MGHAPRLTGGRFTPQLSFFFNAQRFLRRNAKDAPRAASGTR